MEALKVIGQEKIGKIKFAGIEGGFGESKKAMLVRDIALMEEKEYSATDIAKKLGTTGVMVGRTANRLGLKAEQPGQNEYGRWASSKSKYSNKEVPQWLYTENSYRAVKKGLEK